MSHSFWFKKNFPVEHVRNLSGQIDRSRQTSIGNWNPMIKFLISRTHRPNVWPSLQSSYLGLNSFWRPTERLQLSNQNIYFFFSFCVLFANRLLIVNNSLSNFVFIIEIDSWRIITQSFHAALRLCWKYRFWKVSIKSWLWS